jgi:hypothetical protein
MSYTAKIYWFGVLESFGYCCLFASIILLLVWCGWLLVTYLSFDTQNSDMPPIRKKIRWMPVTAVILAFICNFIPTRKDMLMIYGIGGTLDYISKNPEAKQLPDNLVHYINEQLKVDSTKAD